MSIINKKITNVPIAQFETNIAAPLASLTLPLSPVQSFNGYSKPWPGGAGKNKLDINNEAPGSDAHIRKYLTTLPAGTYTVSAECHSTADTDCAVLFEYSGGGYTSLKYLKNNAWSSVTFVVERDVTKTWIYSSLRYESSQSHVLTQLNDLQVELGDAATSYEPYANICPISGWTGANVTRAGENLLIEGYTYGNIDNSGEDRGTSQNYIRTVNYTPIRPSTTYYVHVNYTPQNYTQLYRLEYDANKTLLNRIQLINGNTQTEFVRSFTTTDKTAYIRFFYYSGTTFTTYENLKIWLTLDEVTDYEPSAATVYPVTWSEAGTVYGGEVDIVSGELVVDKAMVDLGTLAWVPYGATSSYDGYVSNGIDSTVKGGTIGICSHFRGSRSYSAGNIVIGTGTSKLTVFTPKGLYASASDFKTAMNGATFVYELATPQTYQLTPTQVLTLLGVNNVWSDTGNITLEYPFRVFDILRVTINGTDITDYIAFQGLKRGRNDVESPNAGRTLDAVMHRGRVATKLRWDVTCRPLTSQELSILENLIMPETVNVTIEGDPYYDTWTRRCYANNTSASYLILKPDGRQLWGGITFPIIEV